MPLINPESVIMSVKRLVESDRRSEIRMSANGGNSLLVVCPPESELEFIEAIEKFLTDDAYYIIDLNELLIQFVNNHFNDINDKFELLRGSLHQIFKTPEGEEGPDLFKLIIDNVTQSFSEGKVPVLIRTGALYGSDIDNIHIMESPQVMNASMPLIILYPATRDGDKLLFLSKRPASKYRCMIIE